MFFMYARDVEQALGLWSQNYAVFAPRQDKGTVTLAPYTTPFGRLAPLDTYINTTMSPKSFVFEEREPLFSWEERETVTVTGAQLQPQPVDGACKEGNLLFGVRPCDAHGFAYMDRFFLGEYQDINYSQRRQRVVVVALNCVQPGPHCFCASTGTGPFADKGYDLLLTPDGDRLWVEYGTEKGKLLLPAVSSLIHPDYDQEGQARKEILLHEVHARFTLQPDFTAVRTALARGFDLPLWDTLAQQCMSCTGCTRVCPTCTCFTTDEEMRGPHAGTRVRCWDSCQAESFTRNAQWHNPRSAASAVRYRVYDKLAYIEDRFAMQGCAGCGRCIEVCPACIDIVRVAETLISETHATDLVVADTVLADASPASLSPSLASPSSSPASLSPSPASLSPSLASPSSSPASLSPSLASPSSSPASLSSSPASPSPSLASPSPSPASPSPSLASPSSSPASPSSSPASPSSSGMATSATSATGTGATGSAVPYVRVERLFDPQLYTPHEAVIVSIEDEAPSIRRFTLRFTHKPHQGQPALRGQFYMLTVFGVGEIAISIPFSDRVRAELSFYIKKVGKVTGALFRLTPGDTLGLRGPFGVPLPYESLKGRDIVVVGSGVGHAPVRASLVRAIENKQDFGRIVVIASAMNYEGLILKDDLKEWALIPGVQVLYALSEPTTAVEAHVGYINDLLPNLGLDWQNTSAIVCASARRIKAVARDLLRLGLKPADIYTALETNMHCGVGKCGHCKVGSHYMCLDGPVFTYAEMLQLPPEF